jgi:hypothetical protein
VTTTVAATVVRVRTVHFDGDARADTDVFTVAD